jgi:antitoxin component YwqK of YwqJK toxin-antitoxin module
MNKILISVFFSLSVIYAQQMLSSEGTVFGTLNNNTETRIIKEYYDDLNISIKMERTVKGNMNHGIYRDYYETGELRTDANYHNGELDGSYTAYHKNGQIYVQVNYKKGDLDGVVTFYEPDGTIIEETTYKNGTPVKKRLR